MSYTSDWLQGFNPSASQATAMGLGGSAIANKAQGAKEITDFWRQATGGAAMAMGGLNSGMGSFGSGALQSKAMFDLGEMQIESQEKMQKKALRAMKSQKQQSGGGIGGLFSGAASGFLGGLKTGQPHAAGIGAVLGGIGSFF